MITLTIAILGGIFNGFRGGLLSDICKKYKSVGRVFKFFHMYDDKEFYGAKVIHDIAYSITFFIAFNFNTLFEFIFLWIGMLIGRSFGWGSYIGGLESDKVQLRGDIRFIDDIVLKLKGNADFKNSIAMGIRGFIWTGCIYISLSSINIISENKFSSSLFILPFIGLLMGLVYNLVFEISERIKFTFYLFGPWRVAEILFGSLLWSSIYLFR